VKGDLTTQKVEKTMPNAQINGKGPKAAHFYTLLQILHPKRLIISY
jgi:hypothetical protein